jgi:hypothetical protein
MAHFCRSGLVENSRQNREEDTLSKQKKESIAVWKRKQEKKMKKKEEYMFMQTSFCAQNKGNKWYC